MKFHTLTKIIFLSSVSVSVHAETLTFAEIWKMVQSKSLAREGAQLKLQSAEEGLNRSQNHWYPKIYLDGRSYRTNDPGNAFFGLLEQRKVESSDFSPDPLNHPDAQNFHRGALGVDIALYEGGMKTAQVAMYQRLAKAEKFFASQVELEQYAGVGLAYGSIASLQKQILKLRELEGEINQLMKAYQLGQKTNPVGYSGLLGMKSLANRIAGLKDQLQAQEKASFAALKVMGVEAPMWSPEFFGTQNFVNRYLAIDSDRVSSQDSEASFKSRYQMEATQAALEASKMEKARYLPRVGAFAESYLFSGSRDSATGYTAGIYLQWSLFDATEFGKYREARLASLAAVKLSEAQIQQETVMKEALTESERALRTNLGRIEESDKLLAEQAKVSSQLFKNGSINALQFVEILNRRTDLILQQSEAEIALLKVSSEKIQKLNFEIANLKNDFTDGSSQGGGQ